MARYETDLKEWCRTQIHDKYREAYRLSIEIGLEAQDGEDAEALAQTVKTLDSAVELLERARGQLANV